MSEGSFHRIRCAKHGLPLFPAVDGFCSDRAGADWYRQRDEPGAMSCLAATLVAQHKAICRVLDTARGLDAGYFISADSFSMLQQMVARKVPAERGDDP